MKRRSRYVASVLAGRPFLQWLPSPLADDLGRIARSTKLVEWPTCVDYAVDQESFLHASDDATSTVLLGTGWRSHDLGRTSLRHAVNRLSHTRCTRRSLLDAHSAILPSHCGWRTSAAWIDAAHPADSWFVAPPPDSLANALDEALSFDATSILPAELATAIVMVRLLQLHPFRDGNGRIARAYFLGRFLHRSGPSMFPDAYLRALFSASATGLHRASLAVRDDGDWEPMLAWSRNCVIAANADVSRMQHGASTQIAAV